METELKTAIWKIANAAIKMHEDKLNGKEFEELAMDALRQVKNLNIPCVIKSVCPDCNGLTAIMGADGIFRPCHCQSQTFL